MSVVRQIIHASCVAIGGRGVLLLGASANGKSDLALRLIDAGAELVGDDQVAISERNGIAWAAPAPRLEGLLEARGVGIFTLKYCPEIALSLAVSLVARDTIERMPEVAFFDCVGVQVPLVSLHAFDRATEAKIRMIIAGFV